MVSFYLASVYCNVMRKTYSFKENHIIIITIILILFAEITYNSTTENSILEKGARFPKNVIKYYFIFVASTVFTPNFLNCPLG